MVPGLIRVLRTHAGDVMALGRGKRLGLMLAGLLLAGTATLPLLAQTETTPPAEQAPAEAETPATETPAPAPQADPAAPVAAPTVAPATPEVAPTADDLEAVEASITLSQERIDELKAEIAALEGDRTKQNAAL